MGNEQAMLATLAHVGPVAVAIDASSWQNYQGGIIQFHCGDQMPNNHAVLVVGYDISGKCCY